MQVYIFYHSEAEFDVSPGTIMEVLEGPGPDGTCRTCGLTPEAGKHQPNANFDFDYHDFWPKTGLDYREAYSAFSDMVRSKLPEKPKKPERSPAAIRGASVLAYQLREAKKKELEVKLAEAFGKPVEVTSEMLDRFSPETKELPISEEFRMKLVDYEIKVENWKIATMAALAKIKEETGYTGGKLDDSYEVIKEMFRAHLVKNCGFVRREYECINELS